MKTDICIIGAGPAGLTAAIWAAQARAAVVVLETNAEAGRKLRLAGGGRCNFTHEAEPEEMVRAFGTPGRFLRHAFYELSPQNTRDFFRTCSLASKVEPNGCVFPVSERAVDVRDVLVRKAEEAGAHFLYRQHVQSVTAGDSSFVVRTARQTIFARRVILATGGVTWPRTGSTGDGYQFAATLGHTVHPAKPALVPLVTRERWVRSLAGLSIASVRLRARIGSRNVTTEGGLMFTHDGIGGPAALDLSRHAADELATAGRTINIEVDFAPAFDSADLDRQIREQWATHPKRGTANALPAFLPHSLASALCERAGCDPKAPAGHVTKQMRRQLVALIKATPLRITGTRPIEEATVTHGGIATAEIDPRTMESKLCPGLFFAGEVIDVDGPCGGYNLQMCFSTGALAGHWAARPPLAPK